MTICDACKAHLAATNTLPPNCVECATRRQRNPVRSVWNDMKQRCYNPKRKNYKYYGGRGIVVCDEWRNSFETFFADMGPRPSDNHSIERIDSDGPYSKGNCKWATSTEQTWNKRYKYIKVVNGVVLPKTETPP
jgi:hypothetical protein